MAQNEITVCLRCDVTPDVLKAQRYVIISLHQHIYTSTFVLMARVLFAEENPLSGKGKNSPLFLRDSEIVLFYGCHLNPPAFL